MIQTLLERYPGLLYCIEEIELARELLISIFESGNKLLLCGNGGSCADCQHIVGELMKGFLSKRPIGEDKKAEMRKNNPGICKDVLDNLQLAVPAIPLPSLTALNSAFSNDVNADMVYAQSLMGLGKPGDVLFCISTSGNSKNIVCAADVAKSLGLYVISLTGHSGGELKKISDTCITVPESDTYKVQELHLPVYHYLCAEIEKSIFNIMSAE